MDNSEVVALNKLGINVTDSSTEESAVVNTGKKATTLRRGLLKRAREDYGDDQEMLAPGLYYHRPKLLFIGTTMRDVRVVFESLNICAFSFRLKEEKDLVVFNQVLQSINLQNQLLTKTLSTECDFESKPSRIYTSKVKYFSMLHFLLQQSHKGSAEFRSRLVTYCANSWIVVRSVCRFCGCVLPGKKCVYNDLTNKRLVGQLQAYISTLYGKDTCTWPFAVSHNGKGGWMGIEMKVPVAFCTVDCEWERYKAMRRHEVTPESALFFKWISTRNNKK